MNIRIVTPAPPGSTTGNRVTAERWARILCTLGHRVKVGTDYQDETCDLLIALHARKSSRAARRFKKDNPSRPLIVCLTGTDLYGDLRKSRSAQRTVEMADWLVGLHPNASLQLPANLRSKLRVIQQSATRPQSVQRPREHFVTCVVGHLRHVKDPLRAAMAVRSLPAGSRIKVVLAGRAMNESIERRVRNEQARNPRFTWLEELSRAQAKRLVANSHALVLSSRSEGGANVISEAVMASVPVLASRIPSSLDLLGQDYPGFFTVGKTAELRALMMRAEEDRTFYDEIQRKVVALQPFFHPSREVDNWRQLLAEALISP